MSTGVELLYEVQPTRYKEKYVRELMAISRVTRKIHIPDAPLGYPKTHVLALASLAVNRMFDVTIHMRVMDLNENALINTLYGAHMLGVKRVLFLRGDNPRYGHPCNDISPEKSIEIARKDRRLDTLEKGLILSLRYPVNKILDRVRTSKPDFVLVMNNDLEKLRILRDQYEGKIVLYMVVRSRENTKYLEKTGWSRDIVDLNKLDARIEEVSHLVDEILITSPKAVEEVTLRLARVFNPP